MVEKIARGKVDLIPDPASIFRASASSKSTAATTVFAPDLSRRGCSLELTFRDPGRHHATEFTGSAAGGRGLENGWEDGGPDVDFSRAIFLPLALQQGSHFNGFLTWFHVSLSCPGHCNFCASLPKHTHFSPLASTHCPPLYMTCLRFTSR